MTVPIAFLGNGEVVQSWCRALSGRGLQDLRVFVRRSPTRGRRADPVETPGPVRHLGDLADTVRGAVVVIAAVPAAATVQVARAAAPVLDRGTLYVDVASSAPELKEEAAAAVHGSGSDYVDAAIMGAVSQLGLQVPVAACGPGSARFTDLFEGFGMDIRPVPGPPGSAARLKLLRSVYLKGRDALIMEMLHAAREYGLEEEVIASIPSQPGAETFGALAERVSASTARHGVRRVAELRAAAQVVERAGVSPAMTIAAAERMRDWIGSDPG
jgi:3-hydroxyisobutyrate dehydrogenase-like beta-hydroxyacid dehydrogenase